MSSSEHPLATEILFALSQSSSSIGLDWPIAQHLLDKIISRLMSAELITLPTSWQPHSEGFESINLRGIRLTDKGRSRMGMPPKAKRVKNARLRAESRERNILAVESEEQAILASESFTPCSSWWETLEEESAA